MSDITELIRDVLPEGWSAVHETLGIMLETPDGYRYRIYPNPNRSIGGHFLEGEHRDRPANYASAVSALKAAIIDHSRREEEA